MARFVLLSRDMESHSTSTALGRWRHGWAWREHCWEQELCSRVPWVCSPIHCRGWCTFLGITGSGSELHLRCGHTCVELGQWRAWSWPPAAGRGSPTPPWDSFPWEQTTSPSLSLPYVHHLLQDLRDIEQKRKGDDRRKQSEGVSEDYWETQKRAPKDFMGHLLQQ